MPYPENRGHTGRKAGGESISPAGVAILREIEDLADDVLDEENEAGDGLPPPAFNLTLAAARRALQVRILANVFLYLFLVFTLLLSVSALLSKTALGGIGGLRFFIEQTDAMAPAIRRGALLVTVNRKPSEIKKGDVITFEVMEGQQDSRLTRVVQERLDNYNQGGMTFFRTVRPEAGAQPDSIAVNQTNVRGVKIAALPNAGFLIAFINTYAAAIAVLAAALCCAAVLLRRWARRAKGRPQAA